MRWVPRCKKCLSRDVVGRFVQGKVGPDGEDGACEQHLEELKKDKENGIFMRYY